MLLVCVVCLLSSFDYVYTVILGLGAVNDGVLGRGLHGIENSMSYHTDGDVIRGIGGHSLVGPELLPKKFKERDLLPGKPIKRNLLGYKC